MHSLSIFNRHSIAFPDTIALDVCPNIRTYCARAHKGEAPQRILSPWSFCLFAGKVHLSQSELLSCTLSDHSLFGYYPTTLSSRVCVGFWHQVRTRHRHALGHYNGRAEAGPYVLGG